MLSRRAFLAAGAAYALPAQAMPARMVTQPTNQVPPGWREFLASMPSDPANGATPGDPALAFSPAMWRDLIDAHREINSSIAWTLIYGWRKRGPHNEGNCTTATMEKRTRLIAMGYAWSALRPTRCAIPDQDAAHTEHCVLTVCTDRGDFILDNVDQVIRPWHEYRYWWHGRLAASGRAWETILNVNA